MLMTRRSSQDGEHGFTLIEVLVGTVLLAVLISGAFYAVVKMTAGTDELTADRKSQRQAVDAIETMRLDISAARSDAMTRWNGTRDDLRDVAFHWVDATGTSDARTMCANVTGTAFISCLRAIVVAQPRELWLRAEVRAATAGGECVGYSVSGDALRRYVSSNWRQCGPALKGNASTVETKLLVANGLSAVTDPFRYTLRYNSTPGGAAGFAKNTEADLARCRTFSYPASRTLLNGDMRRASYITSVEIDLSGVVTSRSGAAVTELKSSIPVTAHTAGEHVYAVGCSH